MFDLLTNKTFGLVAGLSFTALTVGLIIYGNFFATSTTPQVFFWEYRPNLHVCDTAPGWAKVDSDDLAKALKFWEDQGWAFNNIETGPCPTACTGVNADGEERTVACNKGKVTIDLMDKWLGKDHAGVCTYQARILERGLVRDDDWVTIQLPSDVDGAWSFPEEFGGASQQLPLDAKALVAAHEIGHCLVGLAHNMGPPVIPGVLRLNPKTGAVMNPNIYTGGWVKEGLPSTPSNWD